MNTMADELVDTTDENNALTGVTRLKSEAHAKGLWHRAAHIWIYNSRGELLLQLRAKEKELYPDMWDVSAAGHVIAGEEASISAVREIQEEIGLFVEEKQLEFVKIIKDASVYKHIVNNEFYYVYLLRYDGDFVGLRLQVEEVQQIQFVPLAVIEKDLKNNPAKYVPHGNYWFEMIEEIKKRIG